MPNLKPRGATAYRQSLCGYPAQRLDRALGRDDTQLLFATSIPDANFRVTVA
jgi:hypothetical protein